jgi:hypothetical protein
MTVTLEARMYGLRPVGSSCMLGSCLLGKEMTFLDGIFIATSVRARIWMFNPFNDVDHGRHSMIMDEVRNG